jgi:hypothetical protein
MSRNGTQVGESLCVRIGELSHILYSNLIPYHWVYCTSKSDDFQTTRELSPYTHLQNLQTQVFGKCHKVGDLLGIEWYRIYTPLWDKFGQQSLYIYLFYFDQTFNLWYPFSINSTDLKYFDQNSKGVGLSQTKYNATITIEDFELIVAIFGEALTESHERVYGLDADLTSPPVENFTSVDDFPPL